MIELQTRQPTDTWVAAPWNEYVRTIENPVYEKSKGYYYKGHMRIEMSPVGFDHGQDHVIVIFAVNLFAALRGIPITGIDGTTFRRAGIQECQPDIAYYIGTCAQAIPTGTNIVDLNQYPVPDLVIEVAKSSLLDDLGTKRALYEELGVAEYWIIDVQNTQILAYAIAGQGSTRIQASQVLLGLSIALLEETLRRSRQNHQSQVGAWLLGKLQQ